MLALILAAFIGPGDAPRGNPAPLELGGSMKESWDDVWRRFLDRTGRPDEHGPLLQPSPERTYREFDLDQVIGAYPTRFERDWVTRSRGARVWMHSDDEFTFNNRVQLKERVRMGERAALGLRVDRLDNRTIRSTLMRIDFAWPDIRGTGAFVELRGYFRFEKPDLDAEAVVGHVSRRVGRAALRVFALDPFTNASDGLAQSRPEPPAQRRVQVGPSMGASAELSTWRIAGVRAELYAGGVFPSTVQRFDEDSEDPEFAHEIVQSAVLAGGLLEYALPRAPVYFGASPMWVRTGHRAIRNGAAFIDAPERLWDARIYALARPTPDLDLEASVRRVDVRLDGFGPDVGEIPRDRKWFAQLRAAWFVTRVFGFEGAYVLLDRDAPPAPDAPPRQVGGLDNRLLTRFALRFGNTVWVAFGVGWDLDERPRESYDKGSMAMVVRW